MAYYKPLPGGGSKKRAPWAKPYSRKGFSGLGEMKQAFIPPYGMPNPYEKLSPFATCKMICSNTRPVISGSTKPPQPIPTMSGLGELDLSTAFASIPTWGWIAGAGALLYMVSKRR